MCLACKDDAERTELDKYEPAQMLREKRVGLLGLGKQASCPAQAMLGAEETASTHTPGHPGTKKSAWQGKSGHSQTHSLFLHLILQADTPA